MNERTSFMIVPEQASKKVSLWPVPDEAADVRDVGSS
jgi:hypothetical protein